MTQRWQGRGGGGQREAIEAETSAHQAHDSASKPLPSLPRSPCSRRTEIPICLGWRSLVCSRPARDGLLGEGREGGGICVNREGYG